MEEIWKDIKRYDGYKVSNLGNILSLIKESPKVLKGTINKDGYRQHSLINFNYTSTSCNRVSKPHPQRDEYGC